MRGNQDNPLNPPLLRGNSAFETLYQGKGLLRRAAPRNSGFFEGVGELEDDVFGRAEEHGGVVHVE